MTQRLPARLRLAPHRSLFPRGARTRMLGLDPDTALVVEDLDPPLALMLDELDAPIDATLLVRRAQRRGADPDVAAELLSELVAAGVVIDAVAAERRAARRAHGVVVVAGGGALAAGVVGGLAAAGVGTVHVDPGDGRPDAGGAGETVRTADLGTGLVDADRGAPRAAAIVAAARRLVPGAGVGPVPPRPAPDLLVLADAQVPPDAPVARAMRRGTPHLLVRMRDGTGVVGPLVLPGRTACLHCLDLHRADHDPGWPGVAAQLAGRAAGAEPAALAATAALATAQALAALDDTAAPPPLDATLELDATAAVLRRREWTPHPRCACGASRSGSRGGGVDHSREACAAVDDRGTLER